MTYQILFGVVLALVVLGRLLAYRSVAQKVIRMLTVWHGFGVQSSRGGRRLRPAVAPSAEASKSPIIAEVSRGLVQLGATKQNADALARQAVAEMPTASADEVIVRAFQLRGAALAGIMTRAAERMAS